MEYDDDGVMKGLLCISYDSGPLWATGFTEWNYSEKFRRDLSPSLYLRHNK